MSEVGDLLELVRAEGLEPADMVRALAPWARAVASPLPYTAEDPVTLPSGRVADPTPRRAHPDDVGVDLTSYRFDHTLSYAPRDDETGGAPSFFKAPLPKDLETLWLRSHECVAIDTGVRVSPHQATVLTLVPRSSMVRWDLRMANTAGVIDPGYTGPIMVFLTNHHPFDVLLALGDRMVQLVESPVIVRPGTPDGSGVGALARARSLSGAVGERGEGGFGSTGGGR